MTREQIELLCRNIQASTGDWKPEESILLKHDTEQRQIIDEQVEENCGLRRDVRLMQKVNADQRAEIERLQARVAKWESVEALDMRVFDLSDKELTAEFYHNAANVARQMEERWKEANTKIEQQGKEIDREARLVSYLECRVEALRGFLASKISTCEHQANEITRLREALQLLHDHQNGCPLPSYEEGWTRAMALTQEALKEHP